MTKDPRTIQIDVDLTEETQNILQSTHNELSTETSQLLKQAIEYNTYLYDQNKQRQYEKSQEYKIKTKNEFLEKCIEHLINNTNLCNERDLITINGCPFPNIIGLKAHLKIKAKDMGYVIYSIKIKNEKMVGITKVTVS